MLKHLMENGIKTEGGDRLGKTIIFAVNQNMPSLLRIASMKTIRNMMASLPVSLPMPLSIHKA